MATKLNLELRVFKISTILNKWRGYLRIKRGTDLLSFDMTPSKFKMKKAGYVNGTKFKKGTDERVLIKDANKQSKLAGATRKSRVKAAGASKRKR